MPKLSSSFCFKPRSVPFLQTKRSLKLQFSARTRDRPNLVLARAKNWHTNKHSVCTSLEFWLFYYILLNEVSFLPKLSLSFCLKSRSVPFLQTKRSLKLQFSVQLGTDQIEFWLVLKTGTPINVQFARALSFGCFITFF